MTPITTTPCPECGEFVDASPLNSRIQHGWCQRCGLIYVPVDETHPDPAPCDAAARYDAGQPDNVWDGEGP